MLTMVSLFSLLFIECKHPLTVTGQLVWTANFVRYNIADVQVVLRSEDKKEVHRTTADSNGKFSVKFDDNPGKIDVTVTFKNKYSIFLKECYVEGGLKSLNKSLGPFSSAPKGIVTVDFGKHGEAIIWNTLLNSASKLKESNVVVRSLAKACANAPRTLYKPSTGIINVAYAQQDNQDAISHEYGHFIMDSFIPGKLSSGCSFSHQMGVETSKICAFVEGWADFFALYINNAKTNPNPMFLGRYMEPYDSQVINDNGLLDEGRVAACFWDLYDTHNDYNDSSNPYMGYPMVFKDENRYSTVSMSDMITALTKTNNLTFPDFRVNLNSVLNSDQSYFASAIYAYNYVSAD